MILVVDDDPESLRFMEVLLKKWGYEVATARSGTDALRLMNSTRPSLMLLDVLMPGMSGLEVARFVRRHHQYDGTKILFWTVTPHPSDDWEARDLCAAGLVRKPIGDMDAFLTKLQKYAGPPH